MVVTSWASADPSSSGLLSDLAAFSGSLRQAVVEKSPGQREVEVRQQAGQVGAGLPGNILRAAGSPAAANSECRESEAVLVSATFRLPAG